MIKPILFNTDMVRAILEGRKTVTRRVVKPQPFAVKQDENAPCWYGHFVSESGKVLLDKPPYHPGDILYVRETWYYETFYEDTDNAPDLPSGNRSWRYVYKADNPDYPVTPGHWRPSIHMPREAARIFLRVKSVGVDRLQNIADEQALLEGVPNDGDYPLESPLYCPVCKGVGLVGALHPVSLGYMEVDCPHCDTPTKRFANLWGNTIKPSDRAIYGWDANPWVWVIQFERCERPKEVCPHGGAGEGGRLT